MDIMKKTKIEQYLQGPLWALLILAFVDIVFFFLDIRCGVLGGGFGGTDSVVLMVLAVGDQDDRLIGRLVRGKGTGGQVDGGTDRRTLRRDHRRVDRGQEHLGGDIIRGDRQLRESVAGEHDQTYLIIRKAVRQSG